MRVVSFTVRDYVPVSTGVFGELSPCPPAAVSAIPFVLSVICMADGSERPTASLTPFATPARRLLVDLRRHARMAGSAYVIHFLVVHFAVHRQLRGRTRLRHKMSSGLAGGRKCPPACLEVRLPSRSEQVQDCVESSFDTVMFFLDVR